jgi:flagellar biosynthesis/type III secretory pathway protein FliH
MSADDLQPLFAVLTAGTRPFSTAIQTQPTPMLVSSWLPTTSSGQPDDGTATKRAQELADARATAIAEGRAQGLAETAALRATLQKLVAELATARALDTTKVAETIAECAIAAIEGFVATAPKQELFAPMIEAWIVRAGTAPAIAKVHPSSVVALQAAIGDAPITVEADPAMALGDIKIRSESLDTTHAWAGRLRELRDVIATALEST